MPETLVEAYFYAKHEQVFLAETALELTYGFNFSIVNSFFPSENYISGFSFQITKLCLNNLLLDRMHTVNKHWIKTFIFKKIIGMTYFRLFFLMVNLMEKKISTLIYFLYS